MSRIIVLWRSQPFPACKTASTPLPSRPAASSENKAAREKALAKVLKLKKEANTFTFSRLSPTIVANKKDAPQLHATPNIATL